MLCRLRAELIWVQQIRNCRGVAECEQAVGTKDA
jgi:hypothetical protein